MSEALNYESYTEEEKELLTPIIKDLSQSIVSLVTSFISERLITSENKVDINLLMNAVGNVFGISISVILLTAGGDNLDIFMDCIKDATLRVFNNRKHSELQ
jgi:hypothetical protein